MTLTYPHTGNDAFDDELLELIEGVPKYELAYKIVGFCETNKLNGGDYRDLPVSFRQQAQGYLYEGLTPKHWAYRVIATLVAKASKLVKEEIKTPDEVINAWWDGQLPAVADASVLEPLAVAK